MISMREIHTLVGIGSGAGPWPAAWFFVGFLWVIVLDTGLDLMLPEGTRCTTGNTAWWNPGTGSSVASMGRMAPWPMGLVASVRLGKLACLLAMVWCLLEEFLRNCWMRVHISQAPWNKLSSGISCSSCQSISPFSVSYNRWREIPELQPEWHDVVLGNAEPSWCPTSWHTINGHFPVALHVSILLMKVKYKIPSCLCTVPCGSWGPFAFVCWNCDLQHPQVSVWCWTTHPGYSCWWDQGGWM